MAASEGHSAETDHDMCSVEERAEELFNKLANEEEVSSELAGLVVALADLDLQVTEEQVVEATREILQPTEEQFSKDAFLCFSIHLTRVRTAWPWNGSNGRVSLWGNDRLAWFLGPLCGSDSTCASSAWS